MARKADETSFDPANFVRRHIGPSPEEIAEMLTALGVESLDALVEQTIPKSIRQRAPLEIGRRLSEIEAFKKLRQVAAKNKVMVSLIGQGYYGTILPPVIQRNILESPAWYTAYTPYQPEISQGRLEALLNFQTMIADLSGLDVANASLLDEATAAAEAMAMARRVSESKANGFFVDSDCHPQTIAVLKTRAEPLKWRVVVGESEGPTDPSEFFGALFQYPGTSGEVRDFRPGVKRLHAAGAVVAVAADPLALTLLTPPGEFGADIAVGSTQRFGMPMGFGGPHAAYIATRAGHERALPGRLVGVSVDSRGHRAYRLALQTREQHIRREKATSNICTAQVLPAVIASIYAVYHGPEGLRRIANNVSRVAATLASGLKALGWSVLQRDFFDTFTVEVGRQQDEIIRRAAVNGLNLRRYATEAGGRIGISCDETTTPEVVQLTWDSFGARESAGRPAVISFDGISRRTNDCLPIPLRRASPYLSHPVFHRYRSETEILRYIRRLADRDLALDRSMIPLGSCTMKLNGTTEMLAFTWPEFADIHPFAPDEQTAGYTEMIADLGEKLCAISGYDFVSMQPNSGAQGEYAGLIAIRAYHRSRGDTQRDCCLIPSSAHGTNPASAHLAGMEVVLVACDADGNIDVADLKDKANRHSERLAAMMITYPSTHGVFEESIREICDVVHSHGGQVYLDGANLNAQVGLARPGDYGADVSHFNLHKTFCIPHGGGGPGMGPIGVKSHLAPFLPADPLAEPDESELGPVSAAPFGSASILTISWTYMMLMGGEGLTRASEVAILNANYIVDRLRNHYPLLYVGKHGRVAHECILDLRSFKDRSGIIADDVAKRLIDFGFHAPTMSFPVAGTLMIEPTESESKRELDRFCEAMIAIREEIEAIANGRLPRDNNPLKNAPHTTYDLADENWTRPYRRAEGCFPLKSLIVDKYWSPVNRVDNIYGDRSLMCSCPPTNAFQ